MACEVPVVSSRGGALPEVVGDDGSCGTLVPPKDSTALAKAIDQLLDQPERRAAMGRAGRERVLRHFTWRRAAERTVEVYREVIDERAHHARVAERQARMQVGAQTKRAARTSSSESGAQAC